jgi:predicted phosphoribosyltransferase
VASLGIDRSQFEARAVPTEHGRRRREKVFRGDRTFPAVAGRTVVVVDDGIATGATMRAALAALDAMGADDLWVAVPLAPPDTVAELRAEGRRVVCLETPASFFAVGQGYASFPQTSDQEVIDALRSHATARPAVGASAERRAAAARRAASGEAAHEPENVSTDV